MITHKNHRATTRSTVRAACDRCHMTKSRCARVIGTIECERCSRLGNVCAYSAPLPMGRPKDKSLSQSSGSPPKEYAHSHSHKTQREWKRHKRAAERSGGSVSSGHDNTNHNLPLLSPSTVANSISAVAPVDESQNSISDTWIPTDWPSSEFDLNPMIRSDFTPPPNHLVTFPRNAFDHFRSGSFSAFPTPDSMDNPTSSTLGIPSDLIIDNPDLTDGSQQEEQEESESPSVFNESSLHQLLRLQSELYRIISDVSISNSGSHISSKDQFSPESSPSPDKARMSSLDMILGTTQTLIDILQTFPSSPSPFTQTHRCTDSSTRTSCRDGQGHFRFAKNSTEISNENSSHGIEISTTLLSLSCYSSLLVAYDGLIASLVSSPDIPSVDPAMQAPLLSPSLTFGTFSMTAKSSLFVSTVLHVVKQMLEQLQSTFQTRFFLPSNVPLDLAISATGTTYTIGQNDESCCSSVLRSPVISAAHAALAGISEKEKRFMEILAAKR